MYKSVCACVCVRVCACNISVCHTYLTKKTLIYVCTFLGDDIDKFPEDEDLEE